MQIFKNKAFHKWAAKEGLTDNILRTAVAEMEQGLIDADLGGNVFKKRVALPGQGKSGGLRTLLAYKVADKAFFVYGFAKSTRSNISTIELKALKYLAKELLSFNDSILKELVSTGAIVEVKNDG